MSDSSSGTPKTLRSYAAKRASEKSEELSNSRNNKDKHSRTPSAKEKSISTSESSSESSTPGITKKVDHKRESSKKSEKKNDKDSEDTTTTSTTTTTTTITTPTTTEHTVESTTPRSVRGSSKRSAARKLMQETPDVLNSVILIQCYMRRKIAHQELENRIEMQLTRTMILEEIVETEKNYVEGLRIIVETFLEPLRLELKSENPPIDLPTFKDLFPQENIKILYTVGKQFLNNLQKRMEHWDHTTNVGDVFLEMCDYLRIYAVYVEMYPVVDKTIAKLRKEKDFTKFLKKQWGNGDIQRFSSLLITPIQRIPRYQLLLENLFTKTWKDHRDHQALSNALEKLVSTAHYVNDNAKAADSARKLVAIDECIIEKKSSLVSPNRTWVHDSSLLQFTKGEWKKRYFFLFNDLIVRTRANKGKDTYTFLEKVILTKATVSRDVSHTNKQAINDSAVCARTFEFSHPHPINYVLQCKDAQEKNHWCDLLEQIIDELNKADQFHSEERMRIAKDRAHQARALITQQYHSLGKEDSKNLARAWANRKVNTVDLSKSTASSEDSSFSGNIDLVGNSSGQITDRAVSEGSGIRSYKKAMWTKMSPVDKLENVKQAENDLHQWEEEQRQKQEEKKRQELERQKELEEKNQQVKEAIIAKVDSLKKGELRSYRTAIEQYRKAKDTGSRSTTETSEETF